MHSIHASDQRQSGMCNYILRVLEQGKHTEMGLGMWLVVTIIEYINHRVYKLRYVKECLST